MTDTTQFCGHCGKRLVSGSQFCGSCGQPTNEVPQASPGPPPPTVADPSLAAEPNDYVGPVRNAPEPARDTRQSGQWVPSDRPKGPGYWWIGVLAVLAVGGCVALVVLLTGGKQAAAGHHTPPSPVPSSVVTTSSTTSTTAPSEQAAAQALSALLGQSVADRVAIQNAVSDLTQCGPNVSQDAQVFQSAASSRQALLEQLQSLPNDGALPSGMIQDLTEAWQASVQADQDFAGWAEDENSGSGCTPNDTSDSNYQAATTPDDNATTYKTAFASLWNPIAIQYNLTTYQWNQL